MFLFLPKKLKYWALILLFLHSIPSLAKNIQTYNLEVETNYGTLSFKAHANIEQKNYVARVFAILKDDAPKIVDYFQYAPSEDTHIVLDSEATISNGSATVFPANVMELFVTTPRAMEHLSRNNDPIRALVIHEFTHMVHLDQVRGVLKFLKNTFGSIGKLGGVTPRWFTEGVATWAESFFTPYGRLKNDLMKLELAARMLDNNYCQTIDCLDAPGEYPNGQYAYWTGGFFLEYLEGKRPGTIQCLVFDNSSQFIFMLNHSFYKCTGQKASENFREFRQKFIEQYAKSDNNPYSSLTQIDVKEKFPIWQSGFEVIDENLHFISKNENYYYKNILNGTNYKKELVKYDIENIERASEYSKKHKNVIYTALEEMRTDSKRLVLGQNGKTIIAKGESKAIFEIGENKYITFNYSDNVWTINEGNTILYKDEPFVHYEQIIPLQFDDKIFFLFKANFITEAQEEISEWKIYSMASKTMIPLHISDSRFLFNCDATIFLGKKDAEVEAIDLRKMDLSIGRMDTWISDIVESRVDGNNIYMLLKRDPTKIYKKENFCSEIKNLVPSEDGREILNYSKSDFAEAIDSEQNYAPYKYLWPHYWMFYGNAGTDTLDSISIFTTFNDPLDRHLFGANISYYYDIEKWAPGISYTYIPNSWWTSIDYSKKFYDNSLSSKENSEESTNLKLGYDFEFVHFDFTPGIQLSYSSRNDNFDNGKSHDVGVFARGVIRPYLTQDLIQEGSFLVSAFQRKQDHYKSYKGYELYSKFNLGLLPSLKVDLEGTYGHLDKKTNRHGILYGGGYNQNLYSFYGLDYSDLFGNELWTTRAKFYFNVLRPYRGYDLFPAFLKEVDIIAGTDYARANYLVVKNKLKTNDTIHSYYIGAKMKTLVGYLAPVDVEVIFSTINDDDYGRVNSGFIKINSPLF